MLIVGLSFWVVWHETVTLRPWKGYQVQYNELKKQQLLEEYDRAMIEFNAPEVQQKYEELKNRLEEIERNLSDPETQKEYSTDEEEYNEIKIIFKKPEEDI
jgi:hypothetical protein